MSVSAAAASASSQYLLPANQGYTEFQQILLDGLAWGEKRKKILEKDNRVEWWTAKGEARSQFEHLTKYVNTLLAAIPPSISHKGFLSELTLVFGVNPPYADQYLLSNLSKIIQVPRDLVAIIVTYYSSKEPAIEDTIDNQGRFICKPDFESREISMRVDLLISNYKMGFYGVATDDKAVVPAKK